LGAKKLVSFSEDAASAALVVALTPVGGADDEVLAFFRGGPERMAAADDAEFDE
jgi:hypothetical protein